VDELNNQAAAMIFAEFENAINKGSDLHAESPIRQRRLVGLKSPPITKAREEIQRLSRLSLVRHIESHRAVIQNINRNE